MKRLFLDDIREVAGAYSYTKNPIYTKKWDIVRSYDSFVDYINKNGIPDVISFDHDLAPNHYVKFLQQGNLINYDEDFQDLTGYHCAKWLVDYMLDNEITKLPEIYVHSMNPAGRQNIKSLFQNFKKFLNSK